MTTAMVHAHSANIAERGASEYTRDQVELIKRTIARGATDDELQLFMSTARRLGLDPFARQIYAIKRWNSLTRQEEMVTQTAIDGLRVSAERTGQYLPGPRATFVHDEKGTLISAVAYVRRLAHGEWHLIEAEAFYLEYVQLTKEGKPNRMWNTMPRVMLAKCAEALALRRAFPADLSGVYAHEEMPEVIDVEAPVIVAPPPVLTPVKKSAPPPSVAKATAPPPETRTAQGFSPPPADGWPGAVTSVAAAQPGESAVADQHRAAQPEPVREREPGEDDESPIHDQIATAMYAAKDMIALSAEAAKIPPLTRAGQISKLMRDQLADIYEQCKTKLKGPANAP